MVKTKIDNIVSENEIDITRNRNIRALLIDKIQESQNEINEFYDFYSKLLVEESNLIGSDEQANMGRFISYKNHSDTIFEEINKKINSFSENELDFRFLGLLNSAFSGIILPYKNSEDHLNLNRNLERVPVKLEAARSFLFDYLYNYTNLHTLIFDNFKDMLKDAEEELIKFKQLKNIIENQKAEAFYSTAESEYYERYRNNRTYFFITLGVTALISFLLMFFKKKLNLEVSDYWFIKASTIIIGITLISYFLKQSSHYQKLADQCKITRLELEAFPSFTASLNGTDISDIRKELALKYFGREVDSSIQKDISNLVTDQMKSTTEMVKAVTEVIKK